MIPKYRMRKNVPKAIREQVWIMYCGEHFRHKCIVRWCENSMTPFSFEVGHNIPHSKGGTTNIDNLRPICANCNRSMGDQYTIVEFSQLSNRSTNKWDCFRFVKHTERSP